MTLQEMSGTSKWKPYPQIGNYLRVVKLEGKEWIEACPMLRDDSMSTEEEVCEVDDWAQLYQDLFNPPEDIEQDDWKQALLEEISE